ncbi:MAG: 3-dehydroquinate synthase, partial [Rhodoluna sp.]|nr:3-dehydroquinate synthase [Rhodoluna sp.]
MAEPKVIQVKGVDSYDITIGRALRGEVGKALGGSVKKVLVIHPVGLTASAELLKETLDSQGYEAILAGVPDSE